MTAIVLLFFTIATSTALSQDAPLLRGSATEFVRPSPALDPLLWPGNNFDKDAARSLLRDQTKDSSIWQQIPEWQAGNWEGKQAVNTRAIKFVNGTPMEYPPLGVHQAEGQFTKGLLKDKNGGIWHWLQSDYWTETDQGENKACSYVVFCSPGGGEYPDFYAESVDFKVNKASNQIVTVRRAKTWTRYLNLGPGTLKEESVRSNFDQNGNPTAITYNTALEKRTEAFSSYEPSFASKKTIVESLHSYLKQHGLSNLIPPPSGAAQTRSPAKH